jgi:hypothetical protein
LQDRQETGALIRLVGAMGALMLLFTVLAAFFLYHQEIATFDETRPRAVTSMR